MRQRKPFLLAFLVLAVLLGADSGAQATSNTWTSPSLDAVGIFFLNSTGGATALYADNNEWTITPSGQLTFNSTTITNNNLI